MKRKNITIEEQPQAEPISQCLLEDRPASQLRFMLRVVAVTLFTSTLLSAAVLAFVPLSNSRISVAHHQTDWFLGILAITFLAVLLVAHKMRVHGLSNRFETTLEARVGERTRIARELHDTLLQSFHGLVLGLQTVSEQLPASEAKTNLDRTIQQAADAIAEGRDAVQGLRTSLEGCDLAHAVSTLGEGLAATWGKNGRSAAFVLILEGNPRNLHPIVREDIYRISAEALRNAFRHASAERVEVEIRYDSDEFRLRVRDDGKGIDPVVIAGATGTRHFGLSGMRERAGLIGGKLAIWSEVGAGTEVELRVPSNIAFTAGRKPARLPRTSVSLWNQQEPTPLRRV